MSISDYSFESNPVLSPLHVVFRLSPFTFHLSPCQAQVFGMPFDAVEPSDGEATRGGGIGTVATFASIRPVRFMQQGKAAFGLAPTPLGAQSKAGFGVEFGQQQRGSLVE